MKRWPSLRDPYEPPIDHDDRKWLEREETGLPVATVSVAIAVVAALVAVAMYF